MQPELDADFQVSFSLYFSVVGRTCFFFCCWWVFSLVGDNSTQSQRLNIIHNTYRRLLPFSVDGPKILELISNPFQITRFGKYSSPFTNPWHSRHRIPLKHFDLMEVLCTMLRAFSSASFFIGNTAAWKQTTFKVRCLGTRDIHPDYSQPVSTTTWRSYFPFARFDIVVYLRPRPTLLRHSLITYSISEKCIQSYHVQLSDLFKGVPALHLLQLQQLGRYNSSLLWETLKADRELFGI